MKSLKLYLYNNLISLSIAFNTLTGGQPYQSFSARNWDRKRNGEKSFVFIIDKILFFDPDHCMNCWIHWKIGRTYVLMFEKAIHDERHGKSNLN
jgi:hypothetical protein